MFGNWDLLWCHEMPYNNDKRELCYFSKLFLFQSNKSYWLSYLKNRVGGFFFRLFFFVCFVQTRYIATAIDL